jgi:ribokinase
MNHPIITVVGSFAVGMTIRTSKMPVFGETLIGSNFDMGPGGKGSNQAVGVAKLGARSFFAGIIGNDMLGEIAQELYRRDGVDTTFLSVNHETPTGVGFIILNESGQNGIILDMGANKLMDTAFVDRLEKQISASDMVMSVLEIPLEASGQAMHLGKKHGVRTILNPAPAQKLPDEILQNVDFLTPNETELRILMGLRSDDPIPNEELARSFKSRWEGTLIVTLGEQGALICDGPDVLHIPSVDVDVVDTTGAGDAFNAGLAVAMAEGMILPEAVKFANCAGALTCKKLGVAPAMPNRSSTDRLYELSYSN